MLFGPAVKDASGIFDQYWNSEAAVPLSALSKKYPRELKFLIDQVKIEAESDQAKRT